MGTTVSSVSALQLYAPFVGLMALAFWMGVLSQRVRQLEKDGGGSAHLVADMSDVKADIRYLKKSMDDLTGQLAWVTEPAPYATRRKPRASE